MRNFIAFDLEGPLCPQDNAYDLMKLTPEGDRVFEAISRYDDLLALEDREEYEAGDTLALIVPFLVRGGVTEDDIVALASRATGVNGAADLIQTLQDRGWHIFCISTTYAQYAHAVTSRLGIASKNVAATTFALDSYRQSLQPTDAALLDQVAIEASHLVPGKDDERLRALLDCFFWGQLSRTSLGDVMRQVRPVGGRRKVHALRAFAERVGVALAEACVVGDSITDRYMLEAVDSAGGLAVAFNANQYALPYATVSLASTHLSDLVPLLDAWEELGPAGARSFTAFRQRYDASQDRSIFHWRPKERLEEVLDHHRRLRRAVREEASKLG